METDTGAPNSRRYSLSWQPGHKTNGGVAVTPPPRRSSLGDLMSFFFPLPRASRGLGLNALDEKEEHDNIHTKNSSMESSPLFSSLEDEKDCFDEKNNGLTGYDWSEHFAKGMNARGKNGQNGSITTHPSRKISAPGMFSTVPQLPPTGTVDHDRHREKVQRGELFSRSRQIPNREFFPMFSKWD
jgi:hypothetical protein